MTDIGVRNGTNQVWKVKVNRQSSGSVSLTYNFSLSSQRIQLADFKMAKGQLSRVVKLWESVVGRWCSLECSRLPLKLLELPQTVKSAACRQNFG